MTFDEYVVEWFRNYLQGEENDAVIVELFQTMGYTSKNLDEEQDEYNFLMNLENGADIWKRIFGYDSEARQSSMSIVMGEEEYLLNFFRDAVAPLSREYDFVDDFLADIAGNCVGYNNPLDFFKDLITGGCISGMIGSMIYNDSCKKRYIKYIDSLEAYKEDLENEIGSPLVNQHHLPHYTFVCWACIEELAYQVASTLWPDEI